MRSRSRESLWPSVAILLLAMTLLPVPLAAAEKDRWPIFRGTVYTNPLLPTPRVVIWIREDRDNGELFAVTGSSEPPGPEFTFAAELGGVNWHFYGPTFRVEA